MASESWPGFRAVGGLQRGGSLSLPFLGLGNERCFFCLERRYSELEDTAILSDLAFTRKELRS